MEDLVGVADAGEEPRVGEARLIVWRCARARPERVERRVEDLEDSHVERLQRRLAADEMEGGARVLASVRRACRA